MSPDLDQPPPQLGPADVARLVTAHPQWWDMVGDQPGAGGPAPSGQGGEPSVDLLGRGESCTVWRVTRGERQLAVRVPHTPLAELPQPLTAELELLGRVPEGVGALPVAVHEPTASDPTAYLVAGLVPGEVLPPSAWTEDLVGSLARLLARLHVLGRTEGLPPVAPPDLVATAHGARAWWREHEPEHSRSLDPLWPAVLGHQERVQARAPGTETTLVHGDACLTNVVVAAGRPRLVDWEWAGLGDPARDLAYTGGRVHADPWYLALDEVGVRRQVEEYARAREALGRPAEVEPLLVRRAGWLLNETYFLVPHLRRVAARGGEHADRYARTADSLLGHLAAWLGDEAAQDAALGKASR